MSIGFSEATATGHVLVNVTQIDSAGFYDACRRNYEVQIVSDPTPEQRVREHFRELAFQEFYDHAYGTRPCVIRRDGGPAGLPRWTEFNEILVRNRPTWPRIRLVKDGTPVTPSRFLRTNASAIEGASVQLLTPELIDEVRAGATLVFDGVEECHPGAKRLASDFEYVLREPTTINVYASFFAHSGFGPHWDDHDVFVFQVEGEKQWRITPPTRVAPVRGEDSRTPLVEMTPQVEILHAGDILYVPRGWWHDVSAMAGPSLHYTMSLPRRLGLHLLGWVGEIMQELGNARLDVPRKNHEAQARYDSCILEDLLKIVGPGTGRAFLEFFDAMVLPRPEVTLPLMAQSEMVSPTERHRIVSRLPRPVVFRQSPDGVVRFGACGKWFTVTAGAACLLSRIFSGGPLPVTEAIAEGRSEAETVAFLEEMLLEGVIALRPELV